MTPSYLVRLLLLLSASFFVLATLLAAFVFMVTPAAIRSAQTMRPRRAARFLLTLRLLPVLLSAFAVIAICLPSYLLFEPRIAEEEVGFLCLCAAILGASLCAGAFVRALSALLRSSLHVRRSAGLESRVEGETVWIVPENSGLALAGILHPRLLISATAMEELSGEQLAVALRHEHAHKVSRDNLKRLLILLAPPIFSRLRLLERSWAKYAEWAADDQAAEGSADRSLALASALVCVARLQSDVGMPPLVASLVDADEDLSARVDRLLCRTHVREPRLPAESVSLVCLGFAIMAIAMNPASLRVVHRLLERLLD